ncbi:ABC transporter ATP-binding protein [Psychrobacillus lasiicapitis]|uniref:Quaternary amine transport ATP-binding protein n=1 Tax=Psychrobacillus lasiicapitis TaxID=1636719 RepID=A0A544SYL2_9BACI|nr:betaine/proline/choline family ABC transporter ATP-binding protein [Psychrobacillus lasiicapitis]TQR10237.1 betaine/proline/choline family ABC transporter ATP-binding protein [Psychrobacillus lasiicapitis]GGA46577.1 glycine betaine/carnitine/choline transport ATP-binding protein OpuCA [Psychrobacillus lasiicapitis]
MIQFDKVTKVFKDGTEALKDISLTIPAESLVVLIGPSGCGKTTLMKMINRLEVPTSGEVYVDGKAVSSVDAVELRKTIGYVIQRIGLFPHMSIERNASLVPNLKGWTKAKTTERVYELMQMVGLDPQEYLSKYPLELSGGQQQRIGVVRALAGNPAIVLMDEPFSALDPISREQLQMEMKNIQKKLKKTIVFVTHDMDEALKIADTIVIMRNGQIEQIGTPTELIESPINQFVQDFIGIERINRKRSVGKRELQDLIPSFKRSEQSSYLTVEANILVEEAINLLENEGIESLLVKKGIEELGFVNQSTLLRAMLTKEEVS